MKRTFYQSLALIMLFYSFAFLSCNNKKTDSETTNVESVENAGDPAIEEELNRLETQLGELGQSVQEELRNEGDISVYTGQEIMNCDGAFTTLGEKESQMSPTQQQRYQEIKEAVSKMASALNLYE